MKKFLLVLFVGMVLITNLYGIVNKFTRVEIQEVNHIEKTTTRVYME